MGRLIWKGKNLLAHVRQRVRRNMTKALMDLKRWTQFAIDTSTELEGPSEPDDYPHKVTGDLQRSIFKAGPWDFGDTIMGDVGTVLEYGVLHEITDRPFLTRMLHESQHELGRIILQGGVGGKFAMS